MTPTQAQIEQLVADLNATTQREVIRIALSLADNLALTDSKLGGTPYIPQGGALPTSVDGKPLFMLAQINCEQLPENTLYPKKGLLQFWIAAMEAPLYGLDYEAPCSNDFKRVIYYPTFGEALPIDDFINDYTFDDENLPFNSKTQFALHFKKDTESISLEERAATQLFFQKWNESFSTHITTIDEFFDEVPDDICEEINAYLLKEPTGHKIGGYPYFIEYDPRKENAPHTFLLLQIDIDNIEGEEICWGNLGGIANFFISSEDLDNCKFDNIFFHWEDNYQG
ncbi:YwqG family protein [Capnocytophaga gingivalis]|uniref:YwqG family protein n=1 Tax=Capnocytophaga gingivalis TaxID=1017 RepID=A0ABU5ZAG2_9FLAO|nr:YwqG family protein [Capnocytophaga gingivalis]MEB3074727.1 YwqG family protein [Capnocytophaga gingivalis]